MGLISLSIENKGQSLGQVARNVRNVNVPKDLTLAIREAAFVLEGASKQNTPVRTGFLRSSIQTFFGYMMARIQPQAEYGIFVHEGTKFMRGRPFFTYGIKQEQETLDRILLGTGIKIATQITR